MKKPIRSFFEEKESVTQQEFEALQRRIAPLVETNARASKLKSSSWSFFSWKGLSLAGAAAAAVVAVVVFRANVFKEAPVQVAEQVKPLVPVAVPSPAAFEPPKLALRKTSPAKSKPDHRARVAAVPRKAAPRVKAELRFQKVAIEFLKDLDLLVVLPVLRDLDVLRKWDGAVSVSVYLPDLGLIEAARAESIPLTDDFLDQILTIFPDIPPKQQEQILMSLHKLQQIWPSQKAVLLANYETWRTTPAEQRQAYREKFKEWNLLPAAQRTECLKKYEKWKTLSAAEKEKIRRKVLGRG